MVCAKALCFPDLQHGVRFTHEEKLISSKKLQTEEGAKWRTMAHVFRLGLRHSKAVLDCSFCFPFGPCFAVLPSYKCDKTFQTQTLERWLVFPDLFTVDQSLPFGTKDEASQMCRSQGDEPPDSLHSDCAGRFLQALWHGNKKIYQSIYNKRNTTDDWGMWLKAVDNGKDFVNFNPDDFGISTPYTLGNSDPQQKNQEKIIVCLY